jgi:hypothetical protein
LPFAAALCWIQKSLPLPGREWTAVVSWQCLHLPANHEEDDDDKELFEYSHDNVGSRGTVAEAEVVVVEKDGEQGVADPGCDEREGGGDSDCEAFLAGVRKELGNGGDYSYGQDNPCDRGEKQSDLGGCLDSEGAGRGDYAEDEADSDYQLGDAPLEHVKRVGEV